jgi:hypothetical protein
MLAQCLRRLPDIHSLVLRFTAAASVGVLVRGLLPLNIIVGSSHGCLPFKECMVDPGPTMSSSLAKMPTASLPRCSRSEPVWGTVGQWSQGSPRQGHFLNWPQSYEARSTPVPELFPPWHSRWHHFQESTHGNETEELSSKSHCGHMSFEFAVRGRWQSLSAHAERKK